MYAFICLSMAHERVAMRAFSFLSAAFRELASWIQGMAEVEADREACTTPNSEKEMMASLPTVGSGSAFSGQGRPLTVRTSVGSEENQSSMTPPRTSPFFSGRAFDPDGFPRRGLMGQLRSRGLAELVGSPDFFIKLHAQFVAILAQLSVLFSGGAP